MALKLQPPPLQVPGDFALDRNKAGFFDGLLNTIYQMWNTLYNLRFTSKVKTTDATVTALIRVAVESNKTVMLRADVVARRTGGVSGSVGDSAWYTLTGAYKNISGVLTGIGTPDLIGGEDQSGWNVQFSNFGQDAVVVVTGAAGNDITWEGSVNVFTVGS